MAFNNTATSTRYRPASPNWRDGADLPLGCRLVTPRRGFTHHGIYVGRSCVVHYSGLSRAWRRGPVEVVSLAQFCGGRRLWVRATPSARCSGRQAVQRALSRVGENRYRVITNNYEDFCTWCLDGESRSSQVDRWLSWPRAMAGVALASLARVLAGALLELPYSMRLALDAPSWSAAQGRGSAVFTEDYRACALEEQAWHGHRSRHAVAARMAFAFTLAAATG